MVSKIQMSDRDTARLIKEVKKRGCLWNPDDENYSERFHLTVAWDEIAKKLDIPEDTLRVKWKNLRDFFKKEVKKQNIESVHDYQGRWRHFKSMGFLLRPEKDQASSDAAPEEEQQQEEEEYETKYVPDSNLAEYLEVLEEDPIPEKRLKTDDGENDFDMMFLKSLTPFLKQLEPTRNLVVRSKMQDMLLNELAAQNSSHSGFFKKS